MDLAAALIYWVILALWLAVLTTVVISYISNPRIYGSTRLLLAVVGIDTLRNIIENLYFGLYFGAQFGLFPRQIHGFLANPSFLIIPKVINVAAACGVLGLLLLRWLPQASNEQAATRQESQRKSDEFARQADENRLVFETSRDLIIVTDHRGQFIKVSSSSVQMLGYSPSEMIGCNGAEFIYPSDLGASRLEMRLARSGQRVRQFSNRFIRKDGSVITIAWSGVWSEMTGNYLFSGRTVDA